MFAHLLPPVVLAVLAGCSSYSPTAPGGGGDPAPIPVAVSVGNDEFRSVHNGAANPAVDTLAVGGTVTWTWVNTGSVPHSVQSVGGTIFRNSIVLTGNGSVYSVVFRKPGTYEYECGVHGASMSGTIVVR